MNKTNAFHILLNLCKRYSRGAKILKQMFPHLTRKIIIEEFCKRNNAVRSFSYLLRRIERHDPAEIWLEFAVAKENIETIKEVFYGKRSVRGGLFHRTKYHQENLQSLE